MQEKELRIALVCFGGISLAIYIHGVSKEFLKLARASKAFHTDPDPKHACRTTYIQSNDEITDVLDSELVYFDIIKDLAPELDLRVIIDTIAGASAGGMNGIFLGRALAHDLNYDHLKVHWLEEADVLNLVGDKKPPGRLDKMITKPLTRFFSKKFLGDSVLSEKVREKLPALLNIWNLKPPFDGRHMLGLIYRGLDLMGSVSHHSLMPRGHRLELFVTLTDYHGYRRTIQLNDPPFIHEKEHRHKLSFSYRSAKNNGGSNGGFSDFEDKDLPSLSFAARATACYPGAFPPAQLREVDRYLSDKDLSWSEQETFLRKNFREYYQAGLDPMKTSFLDGSILNNKPFDQAIDAIQGRPAYRKVNRRIVYIDPNPQKFIAQPTGAPPSLLNTLKGSLSDIPMNQPMQDALENIQTMNQKVRIIRTVVDSVKPSVEKLVREISSGRTDGVAEASEIGAWRQLATAQAVTEAGFTYEGYARLKIRKCLTRMTTLIGNICDAPPGSESRRRIYSILQYWAYRDEINIHDLHDHLEAQSKLEKNLVSRVRNFMKDRTKGKNTNGDIPAWICFLDSFDVDYQKRRLHFLIQELNTQYGHKENHSADLTRDLDHLKGRLYDIVEDVSDSRLEECMSTTTREKLHYIFLSMIALPVSDDPTDPDNHLHLSPHHSKLDTALAELAKDLNLDDIRHRTDALIADQNSQDWHGSVGHDMTISYLGFGFSDVITFSIMGAQSLGELNEVLVNRISPNDQSVLKKNPEDMPLKGTAMRSFGAFFNRADRENDYLWGRLNGAERIIDLLMAQARLENLDHKFDAVMLKKRAFLAILETEKDSLSSVPELFDDLKAIIMDLRS